MSTIDLTKGGNINLAKTAPGVTRFVVGLGWSADPRNTPDLDASVFLCHRQEDGHAKLMDASSFVFYGNLTSTDGAVVHAGDNLTGDGDGDDERISIDTSKLNPYCDEMRIIVTIHEAVARGQNFGLVKNAYVRIYDADKLAAAEATNPNMSDKELHDVSLAHFDLEEDAGGATGFQFGSLYLKDGEWRFKAMGVPDQCSLRDYVVQLAPPGTNITG